MDDSISRQEVIIQLSHNKTGDDDHDVIVQKDIETIKQLPPAESKWIPCTKRLPKQGQEVICQCRASIMMFLRLDANGDWYQDANHCYMRGFVIAWMPAPKSYRTDG